jgi:hypothetical protein
MKNLKYLNGVLTVIAVCLVLLTLSAVGIMPKATASSPAKYATVPLNADGSINVKLATDDPMNVNISNVGGVEVGSLANPGTNFPYIPVRIIKP